MPAIRPMGTSSGLLSLVILWIGQSTVRESSKKLTPSPEMEGRAASGCRQLPSAGQHPAIHFFRTEDTFAGAGR